MFSESYGKSQSFWMLQKRHARNQSENLRCSRKASGLYMCLEAREANNPDLWVNPFYMLQLKIF